MISIGKISRDQTAKLEEIKVQRYVPVKPTDKIPISFSLSDEKKINVYQIVSIVE